MSLLFLSTTDYLSGQIVEYNIRSSQDGRNRELKAINDQLVFHEHLSFGNIHKRKDNGDLWYINPAETIARFITNNQLELFRRWDKEALLPTDKQLERLKNIGGLPSSKYSLYPNNLQFPARISTTDGKQIDLCLFHFCQAPPFQRYFNKVLLLSDITDIKPSDFALSHHLRLASELAEEVKMSFSPFVVRTNTGRLLTFNGTTQFASTGEIKGNEIVEEVEFSHDRFNNEIQNVPLDEITFIIGKWDNRLEDLFNQYRNRLEENCT